VRITLSGPVAKVTTTTASGAFSFTGLPAGSYTLTEGPATGYADESPNVLRRVSVAAGARVDGLRFTERTSTLAALVYADGNDNGQPDNGELGIPEVAIRLTGVDDRGRDVDVTQPTDANGMVRFAGLLSGVYSLTEVDQPADYGDGKETAPRGDTTPDDQIVDIAVEAGVVIGGFAFGELPATTTEPTSGSTGGPSPTTTSGTPTATTTSGSPTATGSTTAASSASRTASQSATRTTTTTARQSATQTATSSATQTATSSTSSATQTATQTATSSATQTATQSST
jgi:SdrD B-like domain